MATRWLCICTFFRPNSAPLHVVSVPIDECCASWFRILSQHHNLERCVCAPSFGCHIDPHKDQNVVVFFFFFFFALFRNFFSPSFSWFSRIDRVLCCLVFVVVILKFVVVWVVASCHISGECQRFGGTFCLHLESCFYHEDILSSWRNSSQTFGSICKTILCRNPESHNFSLFRICGGRLTQSVFTS